jgi:tRNA (guanine37-N1)-methyltransferase
MDNQKHRFDILSLFPGYFSGPFDESIVNRAKEKRLIEINLVDIRDFSDYKHQRVDDRPYGGGPGMIMMPGPASSAIRTVRGPDAKVIYLSPQGKLLTAQKCRELAQCRHLVLLCGHYEGVDERVIKSDVDEEISIGDYVLTNGCLAAIVLLDAVIRFIPGVLGHDEAANEDSFEEGILDCPHYTRPEIFEGKPVPDVLRSGDHKKIAQWRRNKALEKTMQIRPDLIKNYKAEPFTR